MEIKLDKDETILLTQMLYLGEWMINSFEAQGDEEDEDVIALKNKIFEQLGKQGLPDVIEFDKQDQLYYETAVLDKLCEETIENYNSAVFIHKLIEVMAMNEVEAKFGTNKLESMDHEEFSDHLALAEERIASLMDKRGIKSLSL